MRLGHGEILCIRENKEMSALDIKGVSNKWVHWGRFIPLQVDANTLLQKGTGRVSDQSARRCRHADELLLYLHSYGYADTRNMSKDNIMIFRPLYRFFM